MTNIRRYFRENDMAFLTHVTEDRMPILVDNFDTLWSSIQKHMDKTKTQMIAWAVLPDHFHILLSLNGDDVSKLIRKIKLSFSSIYRKRRNFKSGKVWQNRFWDHIIRNQDDLNNHIDYIHYNPVKHGLVTKPILWEYSSFADYVKDGYYPDNWGVIERMDFDGEFGE